MNIITVNITILQKNSVYKEYIVAVFWGFIQKRKNELHMDISKFILY